MIAACVLVSDRCVGKDASVPPFPGLAEPARGETGGMRPRRLAELVCGAAIYVFAVVAHIKLEESSFVEYLPLQVLGSVVLGFAFGRWSVLIISLLSAPALLVVDDANNAGFETLWAQMIIFVFAYVMPTCIGVMLRRFVDDL